MPNYKESALQIAQVLEDGKGEDVCVIDVSKLNSWTDYFVICTVTSDAHSDGLFRQVKEYVQNSELEIFQPHQKKDDGKEWNLIDLGAIVVHLMSKQARYFYDLEKLWHGGDFLKGCAEKW